MSCLSQRAVCSMFLLLILHFTPSYLRSLPQKKRYSFSAKKGFGLESELNLEFIEEEAEGKLEYYGVFKLNLRTLNGKYNGTI